VTSIINHLEPGTAYEVGAILITNDGNFNDQDIIYGQYNTTCKQPKTTDYNVKLVSGIKSLNITWDTIQSSRYECDVTEYVLTLNSKDIETQEIFSCPGSDLYLNDLLPGIEYKIQLTGKTMNGLLESSPVYSAFPLMKQNDAEITNISTVITNEKIKVFWNILTSNQQIDTINGPLTFTVKYKLTRVLSCSLKEIENEWTSLTIVNGTSFEIFDTVPNAQYTIRIFVGNDDSEIRSQNIVYAFTPLSRPETKPILDIDHPIYVSNNSVYVKCNVDQKECSKLNGFFSKFYFVLKDQDKMILRKNETKENNIYIDNLKSNTFYELNVFIKTNYGLNTEYFLAINFKTKNESKIIFNQESQKRLIFLGVRVTV
ncbi:uncharacterized protein LOC112681404, partial [Sipha flava]|uniref:Uncharacterized protein LOC112681404 n=1 Tax=Sipha flava TaxID=143950 RepID=A0A8B8F9C7_9HEMI